MNRSKDRARLRRIEALLDKHPKGLRQSEIARKLKLHRSTVMRDLPALEEMGVLLMEDDSGRIGLFRRR
jgi:DNA-binding IclR family transcriptional regulator